AVNQPGKDLGDDLPAGRADDVADEQDLQGHRAILPCGWSIPGRFAPIGVDGRAWPAIRKSTARLSGREHESGAEWGPPRRARVLPFTLPRSSALSVRILRTASHGAQSP